MAIRIEEKMVEEILNFLAVIIVVIFCMIHLKLFLHLKNKNPILLKEFVYPYPSFLPEFYRYNPVKFIKFLFIIKKNDSKKLNFYKVVYILLLILFFILGFYIVGK